MESLFIVTAVLMVGDTFHTDEDLCMDYKRDFVNVIGLQEGVTQFTYKGFETEMQTMTTMDAETLASTEMFMAIGYGVPIENCIPKE